ncbi:MAG: Tim44/TimA family putative adaptor protein [Aestuariivirgaceae bacterium]|nr:Tim44/TimA family putative adaptor protein [Aestuariivirgaceae bacterium]
MNHIFDPFNLILIGVAAFIFWRLKSVLGTRTGNDRPPVEFGTKPAPQPVPAALEPATPATLEPAAPKTPVWQGHAREGSAEAKALEAIAAADSQFTVPDFLEGARLAYEMIVDAFAQGDKRALKPLLASDVHESFSAAIDERLRLGETMQSKLVAISHAEIEGAEINGRRASLTIRFVSEFVTARLSREGEVLEGDPTKIREITDIWTFERDVRSRDPNWRLAATEAPT